MDKSLLVVEIVGPAGAGKTTLSLALQQSNKDIQRGLRLRRVKYMPLFVRSALLSLPTLLQKPRDSRWFTQQEIRLMVYLKVLHQVLQRVHSNTQTVIVLDQGPVYKLAQLREFDFGIRQCPGFEDWWENTLKQWVSTLQLIIHLDAPDPVLVGRIQARDKWHRAKEKSEPEAYQILAHSRTAFEQVIAKLTTNDGPSVIRFDTKQETLNQIIERILVTLDIK